MKHYIDMWQNFFNFGGRTSRAGYWWAIIINAIVTTLLGWFLPGVATVYGYLIIIPSLALCFRRLHDVGKSGLFLLWGLLPLVGWIILLIQYCKPSKYTPANDVIDAY